MSTKNDTSQKIVRLDEGEEEEREVCVLLCFITPILGNRYSPGVSSCH